MTQTRRCLLFAILLTITVGIGLALYFQPRLPPDIVLENGARVEWSQCWFSVPLFKTVQCGYFHPSEGGPLHNPEGLRLAFVRIRHRAPDPAVGPVLFLHGGPGYPSGIDREGIRGWWDRLGHYDWPHDLVLLDQRGVGMSRPRLDCPEFIETARRLLSEPFTPQEEFAHMRAAAENCRRRLQAEGVDLARFTTAANVRDALELMEALGGTNWNLLGVSYGSRLAIALARHHPGRLRSVILDSVYPPEVDDLLAVPYLYDNAVETLLRGCRENALCRARFPDLAHTLFALLDRLSEHPVVLEVSAPRGRDKIELVVTDHRLMAMIYVSLYDWSLIEILPAALEAAWRGEREALTPLAEKYVAWQLDARFSDAVFLSVHCHDQSTDIAREAYLAQADKYPRVRKYAADGWDLNICRYWPRGGQADRRWREPVSSNVPALLLAGEHDPVTPPVWAQQAVRHFPRGRLYVFAGIGHDVIGSDACAAELVREFLRRLDHMQTPACFYRLDGARFRTTPGRD